MNEEQVKKMVAVERMTILQAFAESYLMRTQKKTFMEAYPDVPDQYGKLNDVQTALLHEYLVSFYKGLGFDLEKILAEKGQKFDGKNLTEYEKEQLVRLADEQIHMLAVILDRKARAKKGKK